MLDRARWLGVDEVLPHPTRPSREFSSLEYEDHFDDPDLRPEWQWRDPLEEICYSLAERAAVLSLRPMEGDLWIGADLSCSAMTMEVSGDFAVETYMEGNWVERQQAGHSGLLVWRDEQNFVRLDKYSMQVYHRGSIRLGACLGGQWFVVGRGLLRGGGLHLRIERVNGRLTALCSRDGAEWFRCGAFDFPVKDPVKLGLTSQLRMVTHFDYFHIFRKGDVRSEG